MLSMVSSTDSREKSVCSEVHLRFDWQEGRKNSTYEYGHAGMCFFLSSVIYFLHCTSLASQSDVPPLPLRWSGKSRISMYGQCSYLVGTWTTLHNGRASDSKFWQDGYP